MSSQRGRIMDINSRGPEIVVGQLQFEFDGIPPLTQEQRLSAWLADQDIESTDTLTAILFLNDEESRRRRAARWAEVRSIQIPYEAESGWLVSGGEEVIWLYDEACKGYVHGSFFSALLCVVRALCLRACTSWMSLCTQRRTSG